MKTCPKCKTSHQKAGDFCSRSCANSRGPRTEEFKERVRNKLKGTASWNQGKQLAERITKVCLSCHEDFQVKVNSKQKYCSRSCWDKTSGGYRNGSGKAKTGYYKGIYCGSTYELVWVIYNLDHGIEFTRFTGSLEKDGVTYVPDFLLGNSIVEIKGYEAQSSVDRKTRVAESHGYSVTVLRKKDLRNQFDWVKQNYQYKTLDELYDGYVPKYVSVCSHCGATVKRNKKPTTISIFCSRKCAGKFRKSRNMMVSFPCATENTKHRRLFSKQTALEIFNSEKELHELAKEHNVSSTVIWFIKTKRTYKWIHE